MPSYVYEPRRRTATIGAYDVVVVGGGIAGAAAAVAAARNGATTCLVEKQCALGGLATLGIVTVYLPLCDGRGTQVAGGLAEELLKLSVADGSGGRVPACWRRGGDKAQRTTQRYQVWFNPASFMVALERLALQSGVKLMYDTRFCGVVRKRRRIAAVLVESKSGRGSLACGAVVDASGDADVCAAAGERTDSLNTNVAGGWFYTLGADGRTELKPFTLPFDQQGRKVPAGGGRGYAGDDADDVTAQVIDTRRAILREIRRMRRARGGGPLHPLMLPTIPTFRMTRRLRKRRELAAADGRRCWGDAVGMIGSWLDDGLLLYIPLGALTAARTDNLLAAGRCIAVDASAWVYTRAIPGCAVTGQAAGTVAALAARSAGGRIADLDVAAIQARLKRQRVILDERLARSDV